MKRVLAKAFFIKYLQESLLEKLETKIKHNKPSRMVCEFTSLLIF